MRTQVVLLSALVLLAGCLAPGLNGTAPEPGQDGGAAGAAASGTSGTQPGQAPGGSPGATSASGTGTGTATASKGTGVVYDVGRSVHESAWLCQTPVTVNDMTFASSADLTCQVTLSFTDSTVTVKSTGIPNHDYESGGGGAAKAQSFTNTFPLKPELAKAITYAPTRGQTLLAVNGASIYGPEDADSTDVYINTYLSPSNQPRLNFCDAHSDPQGQFHYHADGNCIHVHPNTGISPSDYSFDDLSAAGGHSKIIAFAPDGFPVYGSFGYGADNATVQEMRSSYKLTGTADGKQGIKGWTYVAGLGDLDECNGKVTRTPEFPNGVYAYFSTKHNGTGGYGFPYFPHCYKGVVASTGTTGTGTMGGSTGGTGGMPPPPGSSTSGSMSGQPPPPSGTQSQSGSSTCPPPPQPGQPKPTSPPPPGCPTPTGPPP